MYCMQNPLITAADNFTKHYTNYEYVNGHRYSFFSSDVVDNKINILYRITNSRRISPICFASIEWNQGNFFLNGKEINESEIGSQLYQIFKQNIQPLQPTKSKYWECMDKLLNIIDKTGT